MIEILIHKYIKYVKYYGKPLCIMKRVIFKKTEGRLFSI